MLLYTGNVIKLRSEADWDTVSMLARIVPISPDSEYFLPDQAFYIWCFLPIMQTKKIMACLVGERIIHLISMFSLLVLLFNNYMSCNN